MSELKKYILLPLIVIGALNWGLVGLFNYDLVAVLFGAGSVITRVVYSLVGISAVLYILTIFNKK